MTIDDCTLHDVHTSRGSENLHRAGFASCTPPDSQNAAMAENSEKGVSTRNTLFATPQSQQSPSEAAHWYALRTTYGRERKAYDYLVSKGVTAFLPTIEVEKEVDGKREMVTQSRLPNIFFARGTESEIQAFVYDNVNLPYLRFYYRHTLVGRTTEKTPMIVPDDQIDSLRIICAAEANDIIVSSVAIPKFETGQLVRITDGAFSGVIGRVARYQGQQRVAVVVTDLMTMCTAYIPSAFLQRI